VQNPAAVSERTACSHGANGAKGGSRAHGIGGGIYVDATTSVGLASFSLGLLRRITATTRANDIFGAYSEIL
jgi:hypothetical protein